MLKDDKVRPLIFESDIDFMPKGVRHKIYIHT